MTTGVSKGLAYTSDGFGAVLLIETALFAGSGRLKLTGKLGEVIQESAELAMTFVKSNFDRLGIQTKDPNYFNSIDVHIHFPEGATPKDGPSAGIAITTALVSLFTKKIMREEFAMTGEMTLGGFVLAVGGIKEKCLAGSRLGLKTIIVPYGNRRDVDEFPISIKGSLIFLPLRTIWEVLEAALDGFSVNDASIVQVTSKL